MFKKIISTGGSFAPKTILLVEDEAVVARVTIEHLRPRGYSVLHVYSGEQALEAIHSGIPIDLILMDINLGTYSIDGIQTAQEILKDHDLPVVFHSSLIDQEILEKTEGLGSYGYVVKDTGPTVLNASINMAFKVFEANQRNAQELHNCRQVQQLTDARISLIEYAELHSLEELLTRSLDVVGDLVQSPIGFYHFVEEDQKTLSLQQWSTATLEYFCKAEGKGMHYSIDMAGVWVDCVHTRAPIIHNDYASLPHKKGMPEGHAMVVRELVVPIIRDDKIVAILGIGNKPTDYTEDDVRVVSFLADVTWELIKRKKAELELRQELREKQMLIREVNHRIKNNIASVAGLLSIQAHETHSPEAKGLLQEAHSRVLNIAHLYDVMLKIDDFRNVSVAPYFEKILHYVMTLFPTTTTITVEKRFDDFSLQADEMFALGLIVNELLTNVMKYAFIGKPTGHISISLTKKDEQATLLVQDSGNGLPAGFNIDTASGFGLKLVKMMAKQIDGNLQIESAAGARTTLVFNAKTPTP